MMLSPAVVLVLVVLAPGFIEAVNVDRCQLRDQLLNLTKGFHHELDDERRLARVICELENLNLSLPVDANSTAVIRVEREAHGPNQGENQGERWGHKNSNEDNSAESTSMEGSGSDSSEVNENDFFHPNFTRAWREKRAVRMAPPKKDKDEDKGKKDNNSMEDSHGGKNKSMSQTNSTRTGRVRRGFNYKGRHSEEDSSKVSSEEKGTMTNMTLADCVAVDNGIVTVNATCLKLVSRKVCETASASCKSVSPNNFFLNCPGYVPLPTPPTRPLKSEHKHNNGMGRPNGRH